MNKMYPTLIAVLVASALIPNVHASLAKKCLLGVPTYNSPHEDGDIKTQPVHINAEQLTAQYPQDSLYEGHVKVEQGKRLILADKAHLQQLDETKNNNPVRIITLSGKVYYRDDTIQLTAPSATTNLADNNTLISQGNYQFVNHQGRGSSSQTELKDDRYTIIKNGSFTTCLPNDDSWSIYGTTIVNDNKKEMAEIWNAVFRIGPIPIFYSPYLQFPTSDRRRSGFLRPTLGYSYRNGFEYTQPYYWNIAPNFDATLSPHSIGHRGVLLENEFRYLLPVGSGTFAFDWLQNDKLYKKERAIRPDIKNDSNNRWLLYLNHSGIFNQHWNFNIDYTKVSDRYYFTDLTSQYGSTTDGYVTQKYSIGYNNDNWNSLLSMKRFQLFEPTDYSDVYRAEPQLDFNYYKNNLGLFDFHTYMQLVRFVSPNLNNPKATRFHVEPTLSLPLSNQWGSLNTEATVFMTHYEQEIPNGYNNLLDLKNNITRIIPQLKIDARVILEKNSQLLKGYTQTIEPRIQYLYTGYSDQSKINIYDSSLLQSNYTGLFRTRSYSGLDRIASTNQITTGVTSRFYSPKGSEKFNFSVGQIYYFKPTRTGGPVNKGKENTGSISWAGETLYKFNDELAFRAVAQYDARLKTVSQANSSLEYYLDQDRLLQFNYRYASKDYIQSTMVAPSSIHQQDISQVGAVASWALNDNITAIGTYYYDTKLHLTADSYIGLQYNTCCWGFNVVYGRKIVGLASDSQTSLYDNKLSFGFQLRGFNDSQGSGAMKMLTDTGIIPYQRTF